MAKYLLNTSLVEEDFFADSRLVAIGSAQAGYKLCWWLNQLFALRFIREPDLDVCIQEGKIIQKKNGTLFAQLTPELTEDAIYYPVYRHELQYFDAAVILYTNRNGSKRLIPELKHADFLLLIQYASYMEPEHDLTRLLNKVEGITWTKEMDVETLKSKRNLIL